METYNKYNCAAGFFSLLFLTGLGLSAGYAMGGFPLISKICFVSSMVSLISAGVFIGFAHYSYYYKLSPDNQEKKKTRCYKVDPKSTITVSLGDKLPFPTLVGRTTRLEQSIYEKHAQNGGHPIATHEV